MICEGLHPFAVQKIGLSSYTWMRSHFCQSFLSFDERSLRIVGNSNCFSARFMRVAVSAATPDYCASDCLRGRYASQRFDLSRALQCHSACNEKCNACLNRLDNAGERFACACAHGMTGTIQIVATAFGRRLFVTPHVRRMRFDPASTGSRISA